MVFLALAKKSLQECTEKLYRLRQEKFLIFYSGT